jgi:tetratricopeptide (TPR) repeat protein
MDHLTQALKLIQAGRLDEARIYLEELLRDDPQNTDLLCDMGLCYVNLGQLDKGIELLHRCIQLVPNHSQAYAALGLGYQRKGDLQKAKEYTMRALAAYSDNSIALKNLGAIFGKEGDSLKALYYLRRSFEIEPEDPQTVYGLAFAYKELKDIDNAEMYFKKVLEMDAPGELHGLARNGLREIAAQEFKATGLRMDAVFYLLDAMKTFRDKSFQEIQEVTFEIGMLGKYGLDINDHSAQHVLRSLPGVFTALNLICIMYVGFKQIQPEMDLGIDLSQEYEMAERMAREEDLV